MKKILFAAVVASSLFLVGCGDPCTATPAASKCSADPAPVAPTAAQIKTCQDAAKTPPKCNTEANAVADCSKANIVCGTDNKTDGVKTAEAVLSKCKTQSDAYAACIAK